MKERFFVRVAGVNPWVEVEKAKYVSLEINAGFHSRGYGEPACASFGNGCIEGTTAFPAMWGRKENGAEGFVPSKFVIEIGSLTYTALTGVKK